MKKRILIFSLVYLPHVGGAEIAVKEITDRISPEELEFHMITTGGDSTLSKEENIGNIKVHRITLFSQIKPTVSDFYNFPLKLNKWGFQFLAFFKALKLHRKYSYDGIWAIMASGAGIPSVLFKTRFPSIPYILTLQEGNEVWALKRKMLLLYPLFALSFKRADVIHAISKYLADFGRSMGFKGEVEVIPNGVDSGLFGKEIIPEKITSLKEKYDIKEGDVCLIHVGRLVHKNGVDDIIKALPLLAPHTKLLLVGEGPLKEALARLAEEKGVAKQVVFTGAVSYEKLPEYLGISDIFIRPSLSEGFGNVFIEAMTARVPVIGTQEGGIKDFLIDKETGWVCIPRDPESIARKVYYILNKNNKSIVEGVIAEASRMVADKYQWNSIANKMKELFKKQIKHVEEK